MKRSEFGKTVKLAKRYLSEEGMWGEAEVILRTARKKEPHKFTAPVASASGAPAAAAGTLTQLSAAVASCRRCDLGAHRLRAVFGTGTERARLMFVGEGPGFEEDHRGEPFVGPAGQLLTRIIESIGMKREEVYIANIVKCHPMVDPSDPEKHGNDRPPTPEESAACLPYLQQQIDLIKPAVICGLGNSAVQTLLGTDTGITKLRGKFHSYRGIAFMPTYHPAALLRNSALKKDVWEDMKLIREELRKKA